MIEPLADFSDVQWPLRFLLNDVDGLLAKFTARHRSGKILPNLVEALRIELTYNSNAIEGSTLTLRQTQLAIEGTVPPGNKSVRELYEARNHDLALRMVETWAAEKPGPLSEADLLQIHQRVMTDVASYAGQFRNDSVLIAVAERAEYLAGLDKANAGKLERFARFVVQSVKNSLNRYLI